MTDISSAVKLNKMYTLFQLFSRFSGPTDTDRPDNVMNIIGGKCNRAWQSHLPRDGAL